jgi:hypothetical protein
MNKSITLTIGEEFHLKRGKDRIRYAGMPSEYVYSIVQKKSSGYQGFAWNLFFPKKQPQITIDEVNIMVENVAPEQITLRVME